MANTTNYNWETPDDTDLVKDGAAAIRTLGNSIDTTTKNLNPETTTGDIAYRSATANTNSRLAIGSAGQVLTVAAGVPSWATPNVGDITEVQAGVGISVASGTGPIPVITNSSTDLITTAGDLLYGTAADTVARLGIGTAGQVLKVNSGATAPEWGAAAGASGLTLISRSSFSNVSGQEFSGVFTATYPSYRIIIERIHAGTVSDNCLFQIKTSGGVQTASYYGASGNIAYNSSSFGTVENTNNASAFILTGNIGDSVTNASNFSFDIVRTDGGRAAWFGNGRQGENGRAQWFGGYRAVTETVTGFKLLASTSNITGTVAIYGYGAQK